MNYALYQILIPLVAGSCIGLLYFSGLWQTVQRLPDAPRPWRLLTVSYLQRLFLALGGFYLLMDGAWERLAAAIAGFIIVRVAMTKLLGKITSTSMKGAAAWK